MLGRQIPGRGVQTMAWQGWQAVRRKQQIRRTRIGSYGSRVMVIGDVSSLQNASVAVFPLGGETVVVLYVQRALYEIRSDRSDISLVSSPQSASLEKPSSPNC